MLNGLKMNILFAIPLSVVVARISLFSNYTAFSPPLYPRFFSIYRRFAYHTGWYHQVLWIKIMRSTGLFCTMLRTACNSDTAFLFRETEKHSVVSFHFPFIFCFMTTCARFVFFLRRLNILSDALRNSTIPWNQFYSYVNEGKSSIIFVIILRIYPYIFTFTCHVITVLHCERSNRTYIRTRVIFSIDAKHFHYDNECHEALHELSIIG